MGAATFRGFLGASLIASFFSILVLVIAFATPYWVSDDSCETRAGLWERCECKTYKTPEDWLRSVQVLTSIAIFLLFVLIFLLLLAFCSPFVRLFPVIVAFISVAILNTVILFICMVIAGIEFTDLLSIDLDLHFSYAFLVLAGYCSLCAGIFACCALWYYRKGGENGSKTIARDGEVSEDVDVKEEAASDE